MKHFFEQMYFAPLWYHYVVMILLFPLSLIYGVMMLLRRFLVSKTKFSIPIVSVGNLQVGGAGKTPFVIALASRYDGVFVISRGYGRQSTGLVEVSSQGKILVDVQKSGDEAMLMAESLPQASVIVSEDRILGIENAMRSGAKIIILDDGFNRVNIEKFEILLEPSCMPNILPFPAGGLREFYMTKFYADIIAKEGRDFTRQVKTIHNAKRLVLVTAISHPARLDSFLPKEVIAKYYEEDHAYFDEETLHGYLQKHKADAIVCTQKDAVKMQSFTLPIVVMSLDLEISTKIFSEIDTYISTKIHAKGTDTNER